MFASSIPVPARSYLSAATTATRPVKATIATAARSAGPKPDEVRGVRDGADVGTTRSPSGAPVILANGSSRAYLLNWGGTMTSRLRRALRRIHYESGLDSFAVRARDAGHEALFRLGARERER